MERLYAGRRDEDLLEEYPLLAVPPPAPLSSPRPLPPPAIQLYPLAPPRRRFSDAASSDSSVSPRRSPTPHPASLSDPLAFLAPRPVPQPLDRQRLDTIPERPSASAEGSGLAPALGPSSPSPRSLSRPRPRLSMSQVQTLYTFPGRSDLDGADGADDIAGSRSGSGLSNGNANHGPPPPLPPPAMAWFHSRATRQEYRLDPDLPSAPEQPEVQSSMAWLSGRVERQGQSQGQREGSRAQAQAPGQLQQTPTGQQVSRHGFGGPQPQHGLVAPRMERGNGSSAPAPWSWLARRDAVVGGLGMAGVSSEGVDGRDAGGEGGEGDDAEAEAQGEG